MRKSFFFLFLVLVFVALFLSFGCVSSSVEYFEIVEQKEGYFQEVIVSSSGEFMQKTGVDNLAPDNSVSSGQIEKQRAVELIAKAKALYNSGFECGSESKLLVLFSKGIAKKCFSGDAFDNFFSEVRTTLPAVSPKENFFVHLVLFSGNKFKDAHVFPNGKVIVTTYSYFNQLESAELKDLFVDDLLYLKQLVTPEVFSFAVLCSPQESNFEYLEVADRNSYNYYYACSNNSVAKKSFFDEAKKAVLRAK